MAADDAIVLGLDELLRALERLPRELAAKNGGPVRSALFQAGKVIREEARRRAPQGKTGNLKRAVRMRRERNPRANGHAEQYIIDVRTGRKGSGKANQAYYWRFVEFGTRKAAARPFLRPAFEAKKREAVDVFQRVLDRRIQLAVRRARR